MRAATLIAIALTVALIALIATVNAQDPSQAELVKRCRASQPAWNGYQEDIKEIGARPVARWQGTPVSMSVTSSEVRLTMKLAPPWDNWDCALPILIKDPEARVLRNDRDERQGDLRVYLFNLQAMAGEPMPPWLEIQFPHTRQRLFLDADGNWHNPDDAGA